MAGESIIKGARGVEMRWHGWGRPVGGSGWLGVANKEEEEVDDGDRNSTSERW